MFQFKVENNGTRTRTTTTNRKEEPKKETKDVIIQYNQDAWRPQTRWRCNCSIRE
jgi:hypothetical protein